MKAVLKKNATVVVKMCQKKLPVLYSHKFFTPTSWYFYTDISAISAWPCRAVSHLPMFTRTQRNPASMFELIFFATRPIKRTYINKQIQCNLLFLSAGRQRKINQSQSASQKHIKVLLWTRVEQWPVSLIFNRYPARNPLFLTDKNYFGQESSSAAVVCMANRCKKRSILCHQNRGLHRHILLSEWLKN